jgi:virulence-associated protein VagC
VVEYEYARNEFHFGKGKISTIASGGQVVIEPININTSVNVVEHIVIHEPPAVALSTPVIDQVPINYNI